MARRRMWPKQRRALNRRVWDKSNGRCWYCGDQTTPNVPNGGNLEPSRFTIDHVIPLQRGGARKVLDNLVAACRWCNWHKGDMTVEQFRAWLAAHGHPSVFWYERQAGG